MNSKVPSNRAEGVFYSIIRQWIWNRAPIRVKRGQARAYGLCTESSKLRISAHKATDLDYGSNVRADCVRSGGRLLHVSQFSDSNAD